jgi:hypothetical protein
MTTPCSILLLFLFATGNSAQALSNPSDLPNVTVVQKKWHMEVHNPALDKDPVKAMREGEQAESERKNADSQSETRTQKGMPPETRSVPIPAPDPGAHGLSVSYVYEVKVRNTGEKEIRTLTWEYLFLEPGTERELGRRRFESKVSIGPGKIKNLVMRSTSSPTGTVDATTAGKKPQDLYSEQVVIQRIEYADGSVWQAASN